MADGSSVQEKRTALYDTRLVLGQSPAAEGTHTHVTLLVTAWSLAMPAVMREQAMHHLSQMESVQTWAQPLDLAPGQVCAIPQRRGRSSRFFPLSPFRSDHPGAAVCDGTGGAA
jgi:hypothetical protein